MGISRLDALTIANNSENVDVISYGPYEGSDPPNVLGKFGATICWRDHPHHPGMPIVSCACVYDSKEAAEKAMHDLIQEMKDRFGPYPAEGTER